MLLVVKSPRPPSASAQRPGMQGMPHFKLPAGKFEHHRIGGESYYEARRAVYLSAGHHGFGVAWVGVVFLPIKHDDAGAFGDADLMIESFTKFA